MFKTNTHDINFLILVLAMRMFVILCDTQKNSVSDEETMFQAYSSLTKIKPAVNYCTSFTDTIPACRKTI